VGCLFVRASEARSRRASRSPEALLSAASGVHASSACSAARKRWYKLAMRELNSTKATVLVREAETAMFKRYVEIADSPDACGERVQIENALDDLSALKHLKDTPKPLTLDVPVI
jgi:formylmethanofuran:tetrahydromethanopterin formyltransferase